MILGARHPERADVHTPGGMFNIRNIESGILIRLQSKVDRARRVSHAV